MDNSFTWPHKDLIDVTQLTVAETTYLLDLAEQFHEVNTRPVKKVPTLRGKGVVLFFAEDSTRTKTSFDMAGKRLSADTFSLGKSGSSMNKGESLKDTALTLEAMNPDVIVIRHRSSGAAQFLADRLKCAIINAGDGWHAHPTQALLDLFSLRRYWKGELKGKSLLIMGDVGHSRVARSNVHLLTKMGVNVRLWAPRTLLPAGVSRWPATVYSNLNDALTDVDGVMCLRLQRERMAAGLMPDISEYSSIFCLTRAMMERAKPGAPVMHPGPINRGTDIAADLADSVESLILDQVNAGVAIRMAVLLALCTRTGLSEE
ncbi:Aspartate carbamoyltransferase [uncultured delta proteobacterium]|uniref:Aspartate carbamoyltransferase n=1 Tax=uncultured delta proteobacterium TaxID=34034 RepID=A0A212KE92_9DELT|nr:Aspartate carbamoyltransferase [uncultured delta proteobacterium]